MIPHRKVLILTAGYGEGHVQVARSLKQRFLHDGTEAVMIDLMKEAHPLINKITTTLVLNSLKASEYGLDYYGWSYYLTRDIKPGSTWNKTFNYLGKKELLQILQREQPDAIINTFPFGAAVEVGAHFHIPTFTVVTDFALHSTWIHPSTSKYYVATGDLNKELISKGILPEQVAVSGIPIREAFTGVATAENVFRKILDPFKKTILISAGAYGVLRHIEEMISSLAVIDHCQVAVVCGRNQKLMQNIKEQFNGNQNIHVFGFLENIHDLMALSSCIITKAGGLTLSESISLQLPIFIFKPIAGQEKENANYLEQRGAAAISYSIHELQTHIRNFFTDTLCSTRMKLSMIPLQKNKAADFIVKDIKGSMQGSEVIFSTIG